MKKRVLSFMLSFVMLAGLSTVGQSVLADESKGSSEEQSETASAEEKTSEGSGIEIALVTDVGTIDDRSFNQGSWEGVVKYAEENKLEENKDYKYYRPTEQSDSAYEQAIDLAVEGGAKIVICPGFLFETPIFRKAKEYPEVKFVLVDGVPHDTDQEAPETPLENIVALNYKEEEAGFLAGYAIVKEGDRKLGFMGGFAVPAVVRFGYGFAQGAEVAAKELGLNAGEVELLYNYTGSFEPKPEIQTQASTWYSNGTQTIFACGGGIGVSVMNAAETNNAKVIGVDIDQYEQSEKTVVTSAMKNLQLSVYEAVKSCFDGTWKGEIEHLGAKDEMVLIAMDHDTFKNFTKEDYDKVYAELKEGKYQVKNDTEAEQPTDLGLELVAVNYIKE